MNVVESELPLQVGDRVRFLYREGDWEWLPGSNGPLGPYLPLDGPQRAHLQFAQVLDVDVSAGARNLFGEGVPVAMLLFEKPLGFSCQEEYDDAYLADINWEQTQWPTEFEAPLAALIAVDATGRERRVEAQELTPVRPASGDAFTRLLGQRRGI